MRDAQLDATPDGRFAIGDRVTITLDWAHQLRRHVYDGRRTVEQIRAERTGPIAEIWIGGSDALPWISVRIDCAAVLPWEMIGDIEHVPAEVSESTAESVA